ncbi:hypothetical protein QBC33DRAFT_582061 [Phialemonium atrogriseum]|uniref:F-box domain-containing protein n=1 Tax=Phialemonium atrogriseum TaxID=1093897 RepID=A0AAJ0FCC4_9PEZI|nr:uncharacterized protein QBC33DRAFT_582061 [Phialemonium atrogriseum]KAK1761982.1 hypothetical protein QBC33DRAFT_582061 [Phialemonium atrogriseum]
MSSDNIPGDGPRNAAERDPVILSRRTQRRQKKQLKQLQNDLATEKRGIIDLPYEIIVEILLLLRPSDLFKLARTSKGFHDFVMEHHVQDTLARGIISRRYACLAKCFGLPVLLTNLDASVRAALQSAERQEIMAIHRKPYQHLALPDPDVICTCLTCTLRWNSLCLAVDFAHWQPHLDAGEPIRMTPRGPNPQWNRDLVDAGAAVVSRALRRPLWHARILEAHLESTTRSVLRHVQNRGNKRRHFVLNERDRLAGTDAFLERSGPPTLDFPFHRDNYYMLEAYLPNRSWSREKGRWMYMPMDQHDQDVRFLVAWVERKRRERAQEEGEKAGEGVLTGDHR